MRNARSKTCEIRLTLFIILIVANVVSYCLETVLAFMRKTIDVAVGNPSLMPAGFDLVELRRDMDTHDALHARYVRLTPDGVSVGCASGR